MSYRDQPPPLGFLGSGFFKQKIEPQLKHQASPSRRGSDRIYLTEFGYRLITIIVLILMI